MAETVEVVERDEVEVVIVATTNEALTPRREAIRAGKRTDRKAGSAIRGRARRLTAAAAEHGRLVRVGFNHRYHPAFQKARQLVCRRLGPLMFVRGRYGHGGRVGYDSEWRADPPGPAAAN